MVSLGLLIEFPKNQGRACDAARAKNLVAEATIQPGAVKDGGSKISPAVKQRPAVQERDSTNAARQE